MACRPEKKICYGCEEWFHEDDAEYCSLCTEWICPHCGMCGCLLVKLGLKAVRAVIKTYEVWLEEQCLLS